VFATVLVEYTFAESTVMAYGPFCPDARVTAVWHVPQLQVASHVSVPPAHGWVAFGVQPVAPEQDDHALHVPALHVRVCVPVLQFPHACEAAPTQLHVPQLQVASHVCVPLAPHTWLAFGAQPVAPEQDDHPLHVPAVHARVSVPVLQFPHACEGDPTQLHMPQVQLDVHVCCPLAPQACEVAGEQTPSPVQADHALQVPLLHVRVWVPQLPHA
jgi:hypothetical protein